MTYDFDIPTIIRRFVPVWFRRPRNLQYVYALASWCERMHQQFLTWREQEVLSHWRYNGLVHSLEWLMNDAWDTIQRRIYITVADQVPVVYHATEGDPVVANYLTEGVLSGYYHLDESAISEPYRYEFLVNIPVALGGIPTTILFQQLDIFRFAGRRPAIRFFDPDDNTVSMVYYDATEPPFNQL